MRCRPLCCDPTASLEQRTEARANSRFVITNCSAVRQSTGEGPGEYCVYSDVVIQADRRMNYGPAWWSACRLVMSANQPPRNQGLFAAADGWARDGNAGQAALHQAGP